MGERKKQAVDIFIRSNYSVQSLPSHSLTRETDEERASAIFMSWHITMRKDGWYLNGK